MSNTIAVSSPSKLSAFTNCADGASDILLKHNSVPDLPLLPVAAAVPRLDAQPRPLLLVALGVGE